jgi:hypothetical protein
MLLSLPSSRLVNSPSRKHDSDELSCRLCAEISVDVFASSVNEYHAALFFLLLFYSTLRERAHV